MKRDSVDSPVIERYAVRLRDSAGSPVIERYAVRIRDGADRRVLRVALVADMHGCAPDAALAALRTAQPDIIAVAGDLFDLPADSGAHSKRGMRVAARFADAVICLADRLFFGTQSAFVSTVENAFAFLEGARDIAPVFYSLGNHDRSLAPDMRRRVEAAGATLLDGAFVRLCRAGVRFCIGGFPPREDSAFLDRYMQASDGDIRVLLCHHPEYYDSILHGRAIDLILCGHAHGGQWRAFGRGLYAPGQGLFPRYTSGLYDGRMVVSRGLANTARAPRLGNPEDISVVDLYG